MNSKISQACISWSSLERKIPKTKTTARSKKKKKKKKLSEALDEECVKSYSSMKNCK